MGIVNTQQRAEGNNQFLEFTLNAALPPPTPAAGRGGQGQSRESPDERPPLVPIPPALRRSSASWPIWSTSSPSKPISKAVRDERIQVEDQVAKLQVKKRQIDKLQAELAELGKAIAELEPLIPPKKEEGEILRNVQQLAFDSQLDVIRFSPDREMPKEYYTEKPIPVEIVGSYHNLGLFFDRMMRLPAHLQHRRLHHPGPARPDRRDHDLGRLHGQDLFLPGHQPDQAAGEAQARGGRQAGTQ